MEDEFSPFVFSICIGASWGLQCLLEFANSPQALRHRERRVLEGHKFPWPPTTRPRRVSRRANMAFSSKSSHAPGCAVPSQLLHHAAMRLQCLQGAHSLAARSQSGNPHRRCIATVYRAPAATRFWSGWCPTALSAVNAATSEPGRCSSVNATLILFASGSIFASPARRTRKNRV